MEILVDRSIQSTEEILEQGVFTNANAQQISLQVLKLRLFMTW